MVRLLVELLLVVVMAMVEVVVVTNGAVVVSGGISVTLNEHDKSNKRYVTSDVPKGKYPSIVAELIAFWDAANTIVEKSGPM